MATVESKVGPQTLADGTLSQARLNRDGSMVVSDSHARFYEPNYRGNLFHCSTVFAGVDPQGASSIASSLALAVANPTGSGKNLVLHKFWANYVSGTAGLVAYLVGLYAQGAAALGGTAIVPKPCQLGGAQSPVATAATGATVTAGTPTLARPTGIGTGAYAGGAVTPQAPQVELFDGDLIVIPGFAVTFHASGTAGTTPRFAIGASWEEVPV